MQIQKTSSKSTSSTRPNLSMIALALLALCFSQVPAHAQKTEQTRQITIVQDLGVVGFVPGQTLSFTPSDED